MFAAIGADLSGLNKGLQTAQNKLQKAGQSITGVGKTLTATITAPLVGIGIAAVNMAANFEEQLGLMGIALRGTGTDMEDVRAFALKMGADTVFNAQEMADAMTGLAKSGQTWADIAGDMSGETGTLAAVTALATASDLGLAAAADAVAVAMATFNRPASEAVAIVDNFVQAADASVAEVGGLVDALKNVGPTAAAMGFSLEDTNTALAILSERGIQGGEAGTALKSMLTNMMRPTAAVTEAWQELGVSMFDTEGNMRNLPDIMAEIETAMAGMTQEQKLSTIQTVAGTFGMKAMQTLLAEGATGWGEMEKAISSAATAQDVADVKMGGLKGILEELSGSFESLAIIIGETIMPVIKELVEEHIGPFIEKILELDPELLTMGVIIAGVAAAIGPLLIVLGTLATVIGAIGAPVLIIIGVVAALAAAFATNFLGIRDAVMGAWTLIQPKLQELWDWLKVAIPEALAFLKQWFLDVWARVAPIVEEAVAGIKEHLAKLKPIFDEIKTAVLAWLKETWPKVKETVMKVFTKVGEIITKVAEFWLPKIVTAFGVVVDWVVLNWPKIKETVQTVFTAVGTAIDALTLLWEETLLPALETIWAFIQDPLMPLFVSLVELLEVTLGKAIEVLAGIWDTFLLPALTNVWEMLRDNVLPIFKTVTGWVTKNMTPAFNGLKTAIGLLKAIFVGLKNAIANWQPPAWLTPGSATPFEMGIRGIIDAMRELEGMKVPLVSGRAAVLAYAGQGEQALGVQNNFSMTVNTRATAPSVQQDFYAMQALIGAG